MNDQIYEQESKKDIILEIKDLTMRFGGLTAVSHLNIDINKGSIFGLIGPNGAGKTTVFNMVSQHYKPTQGEILFFGSPLSVRPDKAVKLGIARTFQNIRLFGSMTVRENIIVSQHCRLGIPWYKSMLGTSDYRRKWNEMEEYTDQLLEQFELKEYQNLLSTSLPYGLQRRLEIARALATKPKVLLLDEPAAGMNPQEIEDLLSFIRKVHVDFNLTVFIIEHHMSVIMNLCDRIAVLNYGEKISEGSAEEIQKDSKVIEAYLGVDDNVKG